MQNSDIPQDDLLDVMEMTLKLENYISHLLRENSLHLGMSALMSATINCILGQCRTIEEVKFYRTIFSQIFDNTIRDIDIN